MRTSYSSLETYLQCPQKYKFQAIDKIKMPKSREALFGTLIHDTLHFMFKSDPLFPTLEEIIGFFREHWPTEDSFIQESKHDTLKHAWTQDEEKTYFEEGVKMLKKFYEKNAPWNFTVVALESRFEVALLDEKNNNTHILAGIIDRIDKLPDGKYEIIDYKTARRMPSQNSLNNNLQLGLYSLGLQNRWPHLNPEDIKLSLYFLKHDEKLSTKTSAEATEKTKKHILKTIEEIEERLKNNKDFEPMPSPLCNWCGFRPLCPAWKHLYKKQETITPNDEEIKNIIREYFTIKKDGQEKDARLKELQEKIKAYMNSEGVTRVFGDEGSIAKKIQQRYEYDMEKIKSILSPLGKWEEILKADETKLKSIMQEIPEEMRREIENSRAVKKEFIVLTSSNKKV